MKEFLKKILLFWGFLSSSILAVGYPDVLNSDQQDQLYAQRLPPPDYAEFNLNTPSSDKDVLIITKLSDAEGADAKLIQCGGTFINTRTYRSTNSSKFIITAAHCLVNVDETNTLGKSSPGLVRIIPSYIQSIAIIGAKGKYNVLMKPNAEQLYFRRFRAQPRDRFPFEAFKDSDKLRKIEYTKGAGGLYNHNLIIHILPPVDMIYEPFADLRQDLALIELNNPKDYAEFNHDMYLHSDRQFRINNPIKDSDIRYIKAYGRDNHLKYDVLGNYDVILRYVTLAPPPQLRFGFENPYAYTLNYPTDHNDMGSPLTQVNYNPNGDINEETILGVISHNEQSAHINPPASAYYKPYTKYEPFSHKTFIIPIIYALESIQLMLTHPNVEFALQCNLLSFTTAPNEYGTQCFS